MIRGIIGHHCFYRCLLGESARDCSDWQFLRIWSQVFLWLFGRCCIPHHQQDGGSDVRRVRLLFFLQTHIALKKGILTVTLFVKFWFWSSFVVCVCACWWIVVGLYWGIHFMWYISLHSPIYCLPWKPAWLSPMSCCWLLRAALCLSMLDCLQVERAWLWWRKMQISPKKQ